MHYAKEFALQCKELHFLQNLNFCCHNHSEMEKHYDMKVVPVFLAAININIKNY